MLEKKKLELEQCEVEYLLCSIKDKVDELRCIRNKDEFEVTLIEEYIALANKIKVQTNINFVTIE